MVSYYSPVVTLCVKCTVFEICGHIGRKSPKKTQPTLIWHVPLGWPIANFSMNYTSPETRGRVRAKLGPAPYHQPTSQPKWQYPAESWEFIARKDIRTRDTTYQPDSQPKWQYPAVNWELESWGYQVVYISRSCFRSGRHNTGVWRTDGQTVRRPDTSLSQRPALA